MINMQLTISESTTLYALSELYKLKSLKAGDKVEYISHTPTGMILVEYDNSRWYLYAGHTQELK